MGLEYGLMLAGIGMGIVMAFLGIMVLLMTALRMTAESLEWMKKKRSMSKAPRTKVTAEKTVVKAKTRSKASKKAKKDELDPELIALAVSTYVTLKEKDAQTAAKTKRFRRVWSTAGRYDILSAGLTKGRGL